MKKIITLLGPLFLTGWFTEMTSKALPATNGEPAHILIETAVLTATLNIHANPCQDSRSQAVVSSNLFLPEAVSWFTNLVSVIGQQNGVQYLARFKDPLSVTVAALADEYSVVVLERPRILTADGQTAQFYIGDPYFNMSSQGYFGLPGLWLNVTPSLGSHGLIKLNFRCQPDTAIGMTNTLATERGQILRSTAQDASMVVGDGEIFMADCAMEFQPERISTFRKSMRAFGALFGHPIRKPGKREMIVLFRARQVINLTLDDQGRPILPK